MNKTELISEIAKRTNLSKAQVTEALDAFVVTVGEKVMGEGDDLALAGFGKFYRYRTKEGRSVRNPQTGEQMIAAQKDILRFDASNQMRFVIEEKPKTNKKAKKEEPKKDTKKEEPKKAKKK